MSRELTVITDPFLRLWYTYKVAQYRYRLAIYPEPCTPTVAFTVSGDSTQVISVPIAL